MRHIINLIVCLLRIYLLKYIDSLVNRRYWQELQAATNRRRAHIKRLCACNSFDEITFAFSIIDAQTANIMSYRNTINICIREYDHCHPK